MNYRPINFENKYSLFSEYWFPKVIAEMNNYQFKLVKIRGQFVWHNHRDTDEVFIVLAGDMEIEFRDGKLHLSAGEMYVIPKGKDHRPYAEKECKILVIEPKGIVNTGQAGGALTAPNDIWI
jgi:mannose-6-phosphate isomerase-like protein (cupin superfamily)